MRNHLFSTLRNFLFVILTGIIFLLPVNVLKAQCPLSTYPAQGGPLTPDACGWQTANDIGSGTYVNVNVHIGGIYDFSLCNSNAWGPDDQITGYQAGSGVIFYNDNNGPFCAGTHGSATWASSSTSTIQVNTNVAPCQGWVGISGVLDYRCTGPNTVPAFDYGNGYWNLFGYNAGDANGGAGAWVNCYSGFFTIPTLSFSTTSYWLSTGSPSDWNGYRGCEIAPDNHSWTARRTGFTCGIYQVVVDNHDDLAQVIIDGNTTTLSGISNTPTTVYTGALTNSSTIEFRVSEGTGNSFAQITITPVATGALDPGGIASNQAVCPGGDPALFTSVADASGGAGPAYTGGSYTYSWSYQDNCTGATISIPGANGTTYDPPAGLNNTRCYFRTVTDACGNSATTSPVTVTINPLPVASVTTSDALCNGDTSGTITVTATLGNPPYQATIDGGSTYLPVPAVFSVSAGSYNVDVKDALGCSAPYGFNPVIIGQPTPIVVSLDSVDASCAGVFDGKVIVTASGGTPPYRYSLGGGPLQPGNTFNNLYAGTYVATVYDNNNCTQSATITVNNTYAVTVSLVSQTNISCYGGADGALTVQMSGGIQPYNYSINGIIFQSSGTFTGLSAGTYIVIGRDGKGCTESVNVTIAQPNQLTAIIDSIHNVLCHGDSTGAIYITPTGGTPPYTFLWSNGATTEDNTGLPAGVNNVTITDSKGCTTSAGATVTEPLKLFVSVAIYNNLLCFGDSSGAIDITTNGGVPQYSYSWSNGVTTEDLANLQMGSYTVTVTDANSCSVTLTKSLTQPTPITSSIVGTDVVCFGQSSGTADLTVSGGSPPYVYLWSTFDATQDVSGLSGGLYYVIITDNNGCQKRDSILINEPSSPLRISSIVGTNISCFNANDGSIDITVQGGTPSYTYLWSNGATTEDLSNLAGGTYCVTVTDANGCTASACAVIINPPAITLNFVVTNPLCSGDANGAINLITSGGTPGYTWKWSSGDSTEDISGKTAGVYTVTVTDSRGCIKIDSATITDPPPFYVSGVIKHVTCFGYCDGQIDITAYGGTLPYGFQWAPGGESTEDLWNLCGGSDTVYVTDAHGCLAVSIYVVNEPPLLTTSMVTTNPLCFGAKTGSVAVVPGGGIKPYEYLWNNFVLDSFQTGVGAGHYVVLVTDSNGCHKADSADITEPSRITIKLDSLKDATCSGFSNGAIYITVSGGTGPYTYAWTGGATTQDLINVPAGIYTVTVTDSNGCVRTATYTVKEAVQLYTTASYANPTCFGGNDGFISVIVEGGTIPYTFDWSTTPASHGAMATGLGEGTYTLTVSDANACSATVSTTLFDPVPITVTTDPTPSRCFNTETGFVTTHVTGGTPPYIYQLNGVIQPDSVFHNLLPGNYIVAVRDANGCEGTASFTITAPTPVMVDLEAADLVILQGMTTQLTAHVTPPQSGILTYYWSPLMDSTGHLIFSYGDCADSLTCPNPYVTPFTTTVFTVAVMNSDSCFGYDTLKIEVDVKPDAFIPTAFTPNTDGLNDRFDFDILGATFVDITIWSRWGEKIYANPKQTNGINTGEGWDGTHNGKKCPPDTYVYQMKVTYADGITNKDLLLDKTGTITLTK